jgi:hypothetical protein
MRVSLVMSAAVLVPAIVVSLTAGCAQSFSPQHPVPRQHPRLLGSREELQALRDQRGEAYERMARIAREAQAGDHERMISMALVSAIEGDQALAREAVQLAMKYVSGPIRKGHVTFGHDLARCAIVYDFCHEAWTEDERAAFHHYVNATVDANVDSETHVFHNAWYGYKHWGYGLAGYASYYDNPRAKEILATLYEDYSTRTVPALQLAGAGGGWAEGYYIHYWLYEWLLFCEVALHCERIDLYETAPAFYRQRAVASAFEMYPGIREYGSRRPIPMGDGGGTVFGGDRDKALSARRILVNRYRDDAAHQYVHAFNETTPRSSVGNYAYKDFLWRDATVPARDLAAFRLSHISPGPGYVYARSSWDDDATHFFFKCGDRFTAHQHLDVGHFMIYRHEELVGDGGYYVDWTSPHVVDYYVRSIAHNVVLVHDPSEVWPNIRGAETGGNDGGQWFPWPHHNGAVVDAAQWEEGRDLYDIADILAFEDRGDYLYVAGDCTRAYSPQKLQAWTRQIVYLRPGTFVIFDRVVSVHPSFRKTWVLQAMKPPTGEAPNLVVTNGKGRLFIQALLPEAPQVDLFSGDRLYSYGGNRYDPSRQPPGPVPECRIEVSPSAASATDYFLHVLTATEAEVPSVPQATASAEGDEIAVAVGDAKLTFAKEAAGGSIERNGQTTPFTSEVVATADR